MTHEELDALRADAERQATTVTVLLKDVLAERQAQDKKWGSQRQHPTMKWLGILTEEFLEAAREALDGPDMERLREELVQVAAVAVVWIEAIDHNRKQEARAA